MAFNKDSTTGTLAVVTGLCLVCSIVVSVAAVGLRPAQLENKALDKQSNILSVAGDCSNSAILKLFIRSVISSCFYSFLKIDKDRIYL